MMRSLAEVSDGSEHRLAGGFGDADAINRLDGNEGDGGCQRVFPNVWGDVLHVLPE